MTQPDDWTQDRTDALGDLAWDKIIAERDAARASAQLSEAVASERLGEMYRLVDQRDKARAEAAALREQANLKWVQSLPTQPGWYWLKQPHEKEPEIVYVRLYVNDLAIGNSKIAGWPSLERSLWAGPIAEPISK